MSLSKKYLLGLSILALSCTKEDLTDPRCTDTDYSTTIVTAGLAVIVPNAISPNGDRLNDNFALYAYRIASAAPVTTSNTLKVYKSRDRKELVYESQQYLNEFDGHDSKGRSLPEGRYFYQATLDNNSVQGTVRLVRSSSACGCRVVDGNDPFLSSTSCP